MVPGYESDYEVQSSPLPPPYSPLSPVVKYVLFAVCALFLNEHLHYHLYDHRKPSSNLKEAVQLIVEDLAPKCSDAILQLRIRRGYLVQDAIQEGKKDKFIPGKQLQVSNRIWHILIYKLNSCVSHMSIHSRLSLCLKVELILVALGESFPAF